MKNEKLDAMIDLALEENKLYNDADTGFISVFPSPYAPVVHIFPEHFCRYFGNTGTVYAEDEEYIRKEAYYNNIRFIALFDKEGESNADN